MSGLKIWLIRHGESTTNIGLTDGKPEHAVLTSKGHQQANELLLKFDATPDLIITSPLIRTHETARPILQKWPAVSVEVWPIQEFLYIDPVKYQQLNKEQRLATINNYWQSCDTLFCDSERVESFMSFVNRLKNFHQQLLEKTGFVVVIGHGQFLKAYQLGLEMGFNANRNWMQNFRTTETAQPMLNCEIVKLLIK